MRETLKMANAEDLNRRTFCSLMLLGHIFLSLGDSREAMNIVTPAVQLASKIPDVHIQLWASAILKGKLFYNQLYKANWRLHYKCLFPELRFVSDVRRWRREAKLNQLDAFQLCSVTHERQLSVTPTSRTRTYVLYLLYIAMMMF